VRNTLAFGLRLVATVGFAPAPAARAQPAPRVLETVPDVRQTTARERLTLADLEKELAAKRPGIILNQSWRTDPEVAIDPGTSN
jgi:hypothetical protein